MLHIIGLILRILGILLLCVLGLIVVLLCVLLFVPVRYELIAEFPGKISSAKVGFRITWLLHLLSAKMNYEEENFQWKVRVVWKKFPKAEMPVRETEEEPDTEEKPDTEENADVKETTDTKAAPAAPLEKRPKEPVKEIVKESPVRRTESKKREQSYKENRERKKKPSVYERLKQKIITIWQKIKYTFAKIYGKIRDISKNISDTKEAVQIFLNDEVHRSAFQKVKKELIWIKRLLKPKIFRVRLNYGFEDPCLTGQVLALLGMVYPFVGDNMEIEPDFEQKILKGDIHIKGRIRMIHLGVFVVKLFIHKDTRKTIMEILHMVMK